MGYLSYAPDSPAENCYPVEVAAENSLARRDNSGFPIPEIRDPEIPGCPRKSSEEFRSFRDPGKLFETIKKNKWFPWAFWWNLFEFFCNGDLPMTFARPRFARRSLGGASLRSAGRPRFARRSLASLGWRPLKTVPLGRTLRGIAPVTHRSVPHGPPLKVLWTSGVVPPEGKISKDLGWEGSIT